LSWPGVEGPPNTEKDTFPTGTCGVAPTTSGPTAAATVNGWLGVGTAGVVNRKIWLGNGPAGVAALSTGPVLMGAPPTCCRPRWSLGGAPFWSPASMAGLLIPGRCVFVGPPLSARLPSIGSITLPDVPTWSPLAVLNTPAGVCVRRVLLVMLPIRLCP